MAAAAVDAEMGEAAAEAAEAAGAAAAAVPAIPEAEPSPYTGMGALMPTTDQMQAAGIADATQQKVLIQAAAAAFAASAAAAAPAPRAKRTPAAAGKWTKAEDEQLSAIVKEHGAKNWKNIAERLGGLRTDVQCLHRWNKVLKPGLLKGPWTQAEDDVVRNMVNSTGLKATKWSVIASHLPGRIGKQCRERWFNHLDPSLKKGGWTEEEDAVLVEAQSKWGNSWTKIAKL